MTEEIFCLLLRQGQKQDKKLEVELFLACLLVLLAGQLRFCLMLKTLALDLTISLAIGGSKLISREVAVSLLG